MIQINLLPWREQARQIKKRRFVAGTLLSIVIAIMLIIICHVYLASFVSEQNYINATLQSAVNDEQLGISAINTQHKQKYQLEEQLKLIISLYKNNNSVIRFLDEFSVIVPETISITAIVRNGTQYTLEGFASSDSDVTEFLDILKKSSVIETAVLNKINAGAAANGKRNFEILVAEKEEPGAN